MYISRTLLCKYFFTIINFIFFFQRAKSMLSKKEEGNQAFRFGNLEEAYKLYSDALLIDPHNKYTNSKLYFNRATVCSKVSLSKLFCFTNM